MWRPCELVRILTTKKFPSKPGLLGEGERRGERVSEQERAWRPRFCPLCGAGGSGISQLTDEAEFFDYGSAGGGSAWYCRCTECGWEGAISTEERCEQSYPFLDDYPHGIRCMGCNRLLERGQPYTERLVSMAGDTPVVEIVCVYCSVGEGG